MHRSWNYEFIIDMKQFIKYEIWVKYLSGYVFSESLFSEIGFQIGSNKKYTKIDTVEI